MVEHQILGSVDALKKRDPEASQRIRETDLQVNARRYAIEEQVMIVLQDPKTIERANWLLWVAHNLERVADRVSNICERTVFIATGELKKLEAPENKK
jgi:phosphate transport system protein